MILRICDGTGPGNEVAFDEFKPLYGSSLVTGWAKLHGHQIGILANAQGILFSEEAQKAAQFIQLANQIDVPLLFLHNTTGYMVGKDYEQGGIIKHGAMMINAVSNSKVPHLSVIMGASYGAGNYGMNGRAYDPRFLFTWPSAKSAVMGPAQLAGVLSIVARAAAEAKGKPYDEEGDAGMRAFVEAQVEEQSLPFFLSGMVYDDGVIDPRDTRTVLGICLSVIATQAHRGHRPLRRLQDVRDDDHKRPRSRTALVANRGEIARRVFATCRRLGVETVAVHSEADAGLPFVREADVAVPLPGSSPADTYLRADLVVEAARQRGAPTRCTRATASSPRTRTSPARSSTPGSPGSAPTLTPSRRWAPRWAPSSSWRRPGCRCSPSSTVESATEADLPVLVKASAGGGGRGMRVVRDLAGLADAVTQASAEAESAFGDGTVFVEPYVEHGRHVEVQVSATPTGTWWCWASVTARCSAVTRRWSRRRRRPGSGTTPAGRSTTRRARPRRRSTTSARARWSSWSTRSTRSASGSWR